MKTLLKTTFRAFLQDDATESVVHCISSIPRVLKKFDFFAVEFSVNNKDDLFSCFSQY